MLSSCQWLSDVNKCYFFKIFNKSNTYSEFSSYSRVSQYSQYNHNGQYHNTANTSFTNETSASFGRLSSTFELLSNSECFGKVVTLSWFMNIVAQMMIRSIGRGMMMKSVKLVVRRLFCLKRIEMEKNGFLYFSSFPKTNNPSDQYFTVCPKSLYLKALQTNIVKYFSFLLAALLSL